MSRPTRTPTRVVVLIACLVAFGEIDRLAAGVLTPAARSHSFRDVFGPRLPDVHVRVWRDWAGTDAWSTVGGLLVAHVAVDVVFVLTLAALLWQPLRTSRWGRRGLVAWVVVDLAEDALALLLVTGPPARTATALPLVIGIVTLGKWLLVGALVGGLLSRPSVRRRIRIRLRRIGQALLYQRLSVTVLVATALFAIVPLSDIFDQLPDIQRRWADGTATAWRHFGLAVAATVVIALQLFVLGRLRAERARRDFAAREAPPDDPPTAWWVAGTWLIGPTTALAVGVTLWRSGQADRVDAAPFWVFVAVPVLIWGGSWVLSRRGVEPVGLRRDVARARWVLLVGDVLAISVVAVAGLGLIRSFTAPVLLGPDPEMAGSTARWARQTLLLGVGIAATCLAFPLGRTVNRWVDGLELEPRHWWTGLVELVRPEVTTGRTAGPAQGPERREPLLWRRAVAALGLATILWLLAVLLAPAGMATVFGVVALYGLTLGALATLLGFLIVHLQDSQPLEVFRLIGLRSTPVLTLLLLVPLAAAQLGGSARLHAVRTVDAGASLATLSRQTPAERFAEWAKTPACTLGHPDGPRYRPMLLIAAAGGGIRAAAWTVQALSAIGQASPCAASSALLSSGVSGGSVGLAIARAATDPAREVEGLAGPDALGTAVAAWTVGDVVASVTGVRVNTIGHPDWADRAGLMEQVWERTAPSLAAPFDATARPPTGALLLNSTAAGPNCRVVIGQLDLTQPAVAAGPPAPTCSGDPTLAPATADFVASYGACRTVPAWSTAAMLSARFPFVSPAGRVASCGGNSTLQLVDGGYVDASGLGLLADLAPVLVDVVRAHNATVDGTPEHPFVVPIVLYLQNGPGGDVVGEPPATAPELVVPLVGLGARDVQLASTTWLRRLSAELADPCRPGDPGCAAAVAQVRSEVRGGIAVAAPPTLPTVEAPLGWTLSQESRLRLERAAAKLPECRPAAESDAGRRADVGRACDLVRLLGTG